MKASSQKLLLSLYPVAGGKIQGMEVTQSEVILPQLTAAGRRSLVHLLKTQGLIEVERLMNSSTITITSQGIRVLSSSIPALSNQWREWDRTWAMVVFLEAPASDLQFRFLRQLLISVGCVSLSRGVYLCPTPTLNRFQRECETLYAQNVAIATVGEWRLGVERSFITHSYNLTDHIDAYSGVSKEIDRLLATFDVKGKLDHQQKDQLSMVFDRFWQIITHDPGFIAHYYEQTPDPLVLLATIQKLLLSGSRGS
jgi:DNA-binding transcriptional regulator PaaX